MSSYGGNDNKSNGYNVEDYVTLNAIDKMSLSNNVMTWAIPQTYYSNRRSQVCTVECVTGLASDDQTAGNDGIVISYENSAQNSYSSGNNAPVIALSTQTSRVSNSNYESHTLIGCGRLLTQARPNIISLRIETSQRENLGTFTTPPAATDAQFVICLKFCYYNQLDTGEALHSSYTPLLK